MPFFVATLSINSSAVNILELNKLDELVTVSDNKSNTSFLFKS